MGIGKKLVFSGYMFIMPVIICISIITSIYDYRESVGYKKEKSLQSVQGISSSIWLLQRETTKQTFIEAYIVVQKYISAD